MKVFFFLCIDKNKCAHLFLHQMKWNFWIRIYVQIWEREMKQKSSITHIRSIVNHFCVDRKFVVRIKKKKFRRHRLTACDLLSNCIDDDANWHSQFKRWTKKIEKKETNNENRENAADEENNWICTKMCLVKVIDRRLSLETGDTTPGEHSERRKQSLCISYYNSAFLSVQVDTDSSGKEQKKDFNFWEDDQVSFVIKFKKKISKCRFTSKQEKRQNSTNLFLKCQKVKKKEKKIEFH